MNEIWQVPPGTHRALHSMNVLEALYHSQYVMAMYPGNGNTIIFPDIS